MRPVDRVRQASSRAADLAKTGRFENWQAILKEMVEVENNTAAAEALAQPIGQQILDAACANARKTSNA